MGLTYLYTFKKKWIFKTVSYSGLFFFFFSFYSKMDFISYVTDSP